MAILASAAAALSDYRRATGEGEKMTPYYIIQVCFDGKWFDSTEKKFNTLEEAIDQIKKRGIKGKKHRVLKAELTIVWEK